MVYIRFQLNKFATTAAFVTVDIPGSFSRILTHSPANSVHQLLRKARCEVHDPIARCEVHDPIARCGSWMLPMEWVLYFLSQSRVG